MMTYEEALRRGVSQVSARPELREHALQDAVVLLMHVLGISRATLVAHPEESLSREQQAEYHALLQRRLTFEPMQYILGEQEFYGLTLRVTHAVLIPRPETEHLVEAVSARVDRNEPVRIVDVGTGSGAIAVALAHLLPMAEVTAVDLSGAALEVAADNVARLGFAGRVRLLKSDLLGAVAGESFDAVVSNPPYIPIGDAASLHPQVRTFEPAEALFAGNLGLDVYERLIPQAGAVLRVGGLLAMEIGYGQRDAVTGLLAGWDGVEFVDDLQGIARVVVARKR